MKCKKIAATLAAAVLLATMAVSASAPYKDISNVTDKSAIDYLYDIRCLNFVTSGDSFLPDQAITRGEVAQLFYDGMANFQHSNSLLFKDIKTQAGKDAVSAVISRGIMAPYGDMSFHAGDPVTRENFAVMVYNYLKYFQMADTDHAVDSYEDTASIDAKALPAVQVLHSKNLLVPKDQMFQPKQAVTRSEAATTMYHLLKSDKDYVSHVAVEAAVLKCIAAQYGSPQAYFQQGTLFWNDDTLVLGLKGGASKLLTDRLKTDVQPANAVEIHQVKYSRMDYDLLLNKAIRVLVKADGVRNYIGASPDYANEKITMFVRYPVSDTVKAQVAAAVGPDLVRYEAASEQGRLAGEKRAEAAAKAKENEAAVEQTPKVATSVGQQILEDTIVINQH